MGDTEPHWATEQVTVQVTPLLPGSFETVAVNAAVAPNVGAAELGETDTEIACKLMVNVWVFDESETEVAVIVAVAFAEIGEGAVYVTEVVVCALSTPGPVRLQVTPAVLESLATVAVIFTAWPATAFCAALGPRVMLIGSGGDPDPGPDEHPDIRPATIKAKQNSLFMGRLLLPKQCDSNDADAFRKIKKTRLGDDKGVR